MTLQNEQEIKKFKEQINKDYETTSLFAHETINDYLSQEIELSECVTYIRLCIKRINILKDAVTNSGIFDKSYIEKFNENSNILLQEISALKGTKETVLDRSSILTCNSILSVFKSKYQYYVNTKENVFEM